MVSLTKPQPKAIAIGTIVFLSIILAIFVGLFGANQGDPECNCIRRVDAGWRAASILLVIMMLLFIAILILYPEAFVGISRSLE